MRKLYTALFTLLIPFIVLRLYWKSRRLPVYRERIGERFCLNSDTLTPVDIWLHAVSLGEVVAATPLVECFLKNNWRVLVTTTTPTGSAQVLRAFKGRVTHQYLPYDLPWVLRRFFRAIQARVGIIMETELWPNLITEANCANIPVFLANARLSSPAFKHYQFIRFFLKPYLLKLQTICAQSELDKTRFVALGANNAQIQLLGNMKFDLNIALSHQALGQSLKKAWGETRPVILFASTHPGEDELLLAAFKPIQQHIPNVIALIAPRHPERFEAVYNLACKLGFNTAKRSEPALISNQHEVIILDSLGELLSFYAISDYACMGGSFVPIGGHNVLEPIALGIPVICGPYMQNSQSIVDALLEAHALLQVQKPFDLVGAIVHLHQNQALKLEQIGQATRLFHANQGSVARHYALIFQLLQNPLATTNS